MLTKRMTTLSTKPSLLAPYEALREKMDHLFNDWLGDMDMEKTAGDGNYFAPRVDVKETEKGLEVWAELPGIELKDIEVELAPTSLTFQGKKETSTEAKEESYFRRERYFGSFYQEIPLPWEIDPSTIKADATFNNGVLTVMIPKPENATLGKKKIEIKAF